MYNLTRAYSKNHKHVTKLLNSITFTFIGPRLRIVQYIKCICGVSFGIKDSTSGGNSSIC